MPRSTSSVHETRPGDPGFRHQLALLDVDEGALDKARETLEGLVKKSPQFIEAHVTRALVDYLLKCPTTASARRKSCRS